MPEEPTRVQRITRKLQNHPVIAVIIAVGICIIAVGSVTDAVSKIALAFEGKHPTNATGGSDNTPEPPAPVEESEDNETLIRDLIFTRQAITNMDREKIRKKLIISKDLIENYAHPDKSLMDFLPTYITIHSTENFSDRASAKVHATALKRGALGSRAWHYSVDRNSIVQHLELDVRARHDPQGDGDKYSIAIEVCENRDGDLIQALDRTALLLAHLMHEKSISIGNVVPHQHWAPEKNCPHMLLDDGRPGEVWTEFKNLVQAYFLKMGESA
jgi:N-acetylmuramoyl-L-alanine amidase